MTKEFSKGLLKFSRKCLCVIVELKAFWIYKIGGGGHFQICQNRKQHFILSGPMQSVGKIFISLFYIPTFSQWRTQGNWQHRLKQMQLKANNMNMFFKKQKTKYVPVTLSKTALKTLKIMKKYTQTPELLHRRAYITHLRHKPQFVGCKHKWKLCVL